MSKYILKHSYKEGIWAEDGKGNTLMLAVMDGDKVIANGNELQKRLSEAGILYAIESMQLSHFIISVHNDLNKD